VDQLDVACCHVVILVTLSNQQCEEKQVKQLDAIKASLLTH